MVQTRSMLKAKKTFRSSPAVASRATVARASAPVATSVAAPVAAPSTLSVRTRSMYASASKKSVAPVAAPVGREPYELRPRKQRIIVTIPMTPYFLRPRITFA